MTTPPEHVKSCHQLVREMREATAQRGADVEILGVGAEIAARDSDPHAVLQNLANVITVLMEQNERLRDTVGDAIATMQYLAARCDVPEIVGELGD